MDIDEQWKQWKNDPNQENTTMMLDSMKPVIDKAITSYAPGSSPAIRSQAKILARKAMDNFDPKRGTKFQSYLHTQLQPLQREAMSYDTLHVPERVRFDLRHLNQETNRFVDENGRDPNDEELADFTGISRRRISHLRKFDKMALGEAHFTPVDDDENDADLPATQQAATLWAHAVYEDLNNIDKLIYDMRTGRNGRKQYQVTEIAKRLKMSPSAVSQRLKRISDRIAEGGEYE